MLQVREPGMLSKNSILLNLTVKRILRQTFSLVVKITEATILF